MTLPLDGITVVSIEQAIAAPFCTRQLADLGARVIKIERPGGGDFARAYDSRVHGQSSHFVWVNRSKQSLALDLKNPAALEALGRLLDRADVFVQNLAPGAAQRLGLDWATLHARNPRLIVCDISGYGADGPYRDRKAYDLLLQAESGFMAVTGTADTPVKAGISIADIAAGMYAYSNILAALYERRDSGRGRHIDISLLEALVEWSSFPLYYAFDGAAAPPRAGAAHATIYPYGPFPAGDGGTVMLGLQNEREWAVFCDRVLGQPMLATDPRFASNAARNDHRSQLDALIHEAFAGLNSAEVQQRLHDAGIATARLNSLAQVWSHPQLAARERWLRVDTPAGEIPALKPPGWFADEAPRMDPVPAVGQHGRAILDELGCSAAEIDALLESR